MQAAGPAGWAASLQSLTPASRMPRPGVGPGPVPDVLLRTSQHPLLFGGERPKCGCGFIAGPRSRRITEAFPSTSGEAGLF